MPVAGRLLRDIGSVTSVSKSGNDRERNEPTTNGKSPEHSLLKMRTCYDADSADGSENRDILTAQSVRNTARQLPAGKHKAAIGENSRTLGSKLIFLGIEKQPLRHKKPHKNSVILAKGYHRPGGA